MFDGISMNMPERSLIEKLAEGDLRMMNITGASLFPELSGAAQLGGEAVQFDGYSALYQYPYKYGFA
jgi:hypothetical protein